MKPILYSPLKIVLTMMTVLMGIWGFKSAALGQG